MARRRRKGAPPSHTERWLLTYADLITLLLAFFIVMYSMSSLDARKFNRMADAFSGALRGGDDLLVSGNSDMPGTWLWNVEELRGLERELQSRIDAEDLADQIELLEEERGLVIRVRESAAFDAGSAELKEQMYSILGLLCDQLRVMDNHVRVEGHTDNTPIHTLLFPSNWELSTARATRVVRYVVEEEGLDPRRISALGYGEYRPIADNRQASGRARNRRVDLIVLANQAVEPAGTEQPLSPLALADSLLRR